MVIQVAAKSDIGCLREKNEDSFYVDNDLGLYIICDGMGGHLAGEIASQKAIELTVEFLERARDQRILPRIHDKDFALVWGQLVVEAIENCCDDLWEFAKQNPQFDGMATTLTLVLIVQGVAFVGHLGDSRLYLKKGNVARQLTRDHTLFEEFTRSDPDWIGVNNDPAALQRFRHILTRCVGRKREFSVESFSFPLANEDVLLLCTDGVSNYFDDERDVVDFLRDDDTDTVVQDLVDYANAQGGHDNATAIVIRVARKTPRPIKSARF